MKILNGLDIVNLHRDFRDKITEVEDALSRLSDYGYTQSVLETELSKLRKELQALEDTRFQALEPVIIGTSLLGGKMTAPK